ncbi:SH3 domain-containing protein [Micromonospora sp. DSM 115977]|uniref:SH3 domain-containing protein n=1 Tax=Micromonospora reichwaldensis TaxID=3075516 RepID=A0ABU2X3S3_9ACTN|nr:SH3 domain-containing protein [Micromonospora sp. DSM 115977]MDT0532403.1 SH3 domain-containing protein [Micromonospora sp. DSM 115977]
MRRARELIAVAALVAAAVLAPAQPASAGLSSPARGTTVKAAEGVHLRTGPGTSYGSIAVVPVGHTATVLSPTPSNSFYQVNYQGSVGWTHGSYWDATPGLVVNGHRISADEEKWVRWIAANTMPRIAGTRSTRLVNASRVTWWSLKEAALEMDNVHPYSHCGGLIGPLALCPSGAAWQVGIAAVQVPNFSLSENEAVALQLYPGWTVRQVLAHTASYSGYPSGTATHDAIVNSTGSLRNSWLLRNHGVGFTQVTKDVARECVTGSLYWCYGTGWLESRLYAPNKAASLRVIGELNAILDGLAP